MSVTLYIICDEGIFVYGGFKRSPSQTCRTHKDTNASHLPLFNNHTPNIRRWHVEEIQKCENTKSHSHTSSRHTHKQTHPSTHTHTTMTQSHLFLIGAFTDSRCTGVAPAGSPLVFTLADPLKETGSVKLFLVLHSTTRPHLDSHQNTLWKVVYWYILTNKQKKNPHNVTMSWPAVILNIFTWYQNTRVV